MTNPTDPIPPSPECDRMAKVSDKSQSIGNFLDWLLHEKGVFLARHEEWEEEQPTFRSALLDSDDPRYETEIIKREATLRWSYSIQDLLAEFFNIGLDKVEAERRAILDAIREHGIAEVD